MPARRTRIGCLLAGVFVLSILDYRVTALARPAHQVVREGTSKSEKVEGARPRASVRGTDAATSSQTPPHFDSKQNPVESAPALVNRQEAQSLRFHFPPPRHDFAAVPHSRRALQPAVRNSIGVSVPSNNINSCTAPWGPNSRPIVSQTLSIEHGATSRIGSINTRPVGPMGSARGAASLPTTSRTAAISGTGLCAAASGRRKLAGRPAKHALSTVSNSVQTGSALWGLHVAGWVMREGEHDEVRIAVRGAGFCGLDSPGTSGGIMYRAGLRWYR
jgi:hypothetical protein